MTPTREWLGKLRYLLYAIRPVAGLQVVAQSPDGEPRRIDIRTRMGPERRVLDISDPTKVDYWKMREEFERESKEDRHTYYEMGDDALVWKMPAFDLGDNEMESLIGKAKKRKALVVDMRGNKGGYVDTLEQLVRLTFPHDVNVGELRERKGARPWQVRVSSKAFSGKIVALVDSDSASSAEIYARLLQLEKRGTVLGDRTMGAVMQARFAHHEMGADQVIPFGASISTGAVVMSDGNVLEHHGVVPDEPILPTAQDLAAGRDPVLSHALKLAGVDVNPAAAGKLFPVQWSSK